MNGYNGFKKNFIMKKIKIGEFMTEQDIQATLGVHYGCGCKAANGSMNIIVPNVLMYTANGMYEADFITITKSNYLIEIEIKISITDFRADFTKKHFHDSPEVNSLYYAIPKDLYEKYKEEIEKSCEKIGAGIIIIKQNCYWGGIAKKPKLRKVKPLTISQQLKYARLGCLRWPNNWNK